MGRQEDGDAGYQKTGGHTLDPSGVGWGGKNPNCLLLEWKQGQKGKKKREKKENPRDDILTSHQQQAAGKGQ